LRFARYYTQSEGIVKLTYLGLCRYISAETTLHRNDNKRREFIFPSWCPEQVCDITVTSAPEEHFEIIMFTAPYMGIISFPGYDIIANLGVFCETQKKRVLN